MADATVIPFPITTTRAREQERLRRALEQLQDAVAEQKRALSDWRFAMAELGIGVAGLGQSLMSYQDGLGEVDVKLSGLRSATASLGRSAGPRTPGPGANGSAATRPN